LEKQGNDGLIDYHIQNKEILLCFLGNTPYRMLIDEFLISNF